MLGQPLAAHHGAVGTAEVFDPRDAGLPVEGGVHARNTNVVDSHVGFRDAPDQKPPAIGQGMFDESSFSDDDETQRRRFGMCVVDRRGSRILIRHAYQYAWSAMTGQFDGHGRVSRSFSLPMLWLAMPTCLLKEQDRSAA
jgi:hypothetical protein